MKAVESSVPLLELDATKPRECGRMHGELLRDKVRAMAEIRLSFMLQDTGFTSMNDIFEIARAHLPLLQKFDEALFEELLGVAEGSDLSPEKIVVLNHYTDLRDLRPHHQESNWLQADGGCSAVFIPGRTGPILGQTWDIHGSAEDYVTLLKLKQTYEGGEEEGEALVFSIAGCLGMTGFSNKGVGITINNLNSYDARIGIIWPALVRKVLKQKNAEAGKDMVMNVRLGSGHHYLIADKSHVFGIETSGTKKKITQRGSERIHCHTNHCLDPEMAQTHGMRAGSTSYERFATLEKLMAEHPPQTPAELFESLEAVSMPRKKENPVHQTATCGAMVMDLSNLRALVCVGTPSVQQGNFPEVMELQV